MPISFAPRPPQGGQRSQDLSSKAATESPPLVLVDEQEICQREKHLLALDSCRRIFLQISPKFPRAGLREGCKKSKWKFKMAFAKGGGGLEGVSFAIKLF